MKTNEQILDEMRFLVDKENQVQLDELEQQAKELVFNNLKEISKNMSNELSIEMLCLVCNDLSKRLDKLEEANERRSRD